MTGSAISGVFACPACRCAHAGYLLTIPTRCKLLDHLELQRRDTPAGHSQRIGRRIRDIDNASVAAVVVDPNRHRSPARNARRRWRACMVVPRERGMLSRGSDAPAGRERHRQIALQRRLPAAAGKSGISADDRGLRAGRKRRRRQSCGQPSQDVAATRDRNRRHVSDMICLDGNVRNSGAADGRHRLFPTRNPNPT